MFFGLFGDAAGIIQGHSRACVGILGGCYTILSGPSTPDSGNQKGKQCKKTSKLCIQGLIRIITPIMVLFPHN